MLLLRCGNRNRYYDSSTIVVSRVIAMPIKFSSLTSIQLIKRNYFYALSSFGGVHLSTVCSFCFNCFFAFSKGESLFTFLFVDLMPSTGCCHYFLYFINFGYFMNNYFSYFFVVLAVWHY